MPRILLLMTLLFTMTSVSGWGVYERTRAVYNVDHMGAYTGSGRKATAQQVHDAIIAGATSKGWSIEESADGHLIAQIYVRSHMAQVDIKYDETGYSITYKDSTNLDYDGTEIHRNYNGWIREMVVKINEVIRSY